MQSREGRGAAGRRYFETRPYQDGAKRVYRVWQPPGEDGEGERAQGSFFVGKSGRWYEYVDKTIEQFPNSVQFAYERTEAAQRREANDPVSQVTIALEANRVAMKKERDRMTNDLLDGPTDPNPTGDTLLTAVSAIVRALASVPPECRQQVMAAAQVLMPQPQAKRAEPPTMIEWHAQRREQSQHAQEIVKKHTEAQGRAFGAIPSPQQEQAASRPYVDLDPRGEPREPKR